MVKSFQAVSQTPLRCKAIHNEDNTPELTLPQSLYLTRPMYFSTPTVSKQLSLDKVITKLDIIIDNLPISLKDK